MPKKTAMAQLITKLNGIITQQEAEQIIYDALELEKEIIAAAYDDARKDIADGVTMDGIEYYESTFDNQ